MAVKIALVVGLFIVICGTSGLKSSQEVPEGLVYTEVKKTLVRGAQDVLTCRFYGDPLTVYWRKGLDLDNLSPMVAWHDGKVSGPRFEDGSCDVDENYSLIINNVSRADVGRMYCTVSNNKGPLMNNYTDILVVDTAITTNPQATLQLRQATYGVLPCTVHIKARRVSWKKGSTSSGNESLVIIENNQGSAERSGAGYEDGAYNITQEYSLVIKELQLHHEGLYICEVTDDTGTSFHNHTFVNVVAQPLEPFPTIQECLNTEQHDSTYCILVAKSGTTLTCQAVKYYPSLNLVFLYGSRALEPSDTKEWDNIDGTYNKTIRITPSGNKELYSCVASSVPGTNVNQSTSVLLQGGEPDKSALVISLVLFATLILISSVAYYIWRTKRRNYSAVKRSNQHPEHDDIVGVKDLTQNFKALEQRVNDVSITHYTRFHDLLETESAVQAKTVIRENMNALFNTHNMLIDWRENRISTRNKETSDTENEPADDWPSNEELKMISRHLTQDSMKKICRKLKIDCRNDDANDEGTRFEILQKWRTKITHKSLKEKYNELNAVLESNNLGGLLPAIRGPYIYKAELVDMALRLLMQDLRPVVEQLGINDTKLASYRPAFHHGHLGIGTIKLLIKLFASTESSLLHYEKEDDKRSILCSKITSLHYRNIAITGMFEYDMSYGELCSIPEAIHKNTERLADQEATSSMLTSPGVNITEELDILQDVLQLTAQDIADRPDTSSPLTAYALFKMWKEQPRPSFYNYRSALALELRRNMIPGLADEIIAGKYITERTSLAFIEDMVRGLNQDQIRSLWKLLRSSGGEEQCDTTTPLNQISKQIYHRVADLINGTHESLKPSALGNVNNWKNATAEDFRDLNDSLVEHGFLDLARELMIIEQQRHNWL